ncbi:hypothetical protein C8J57DRAFT_1533635 [Mycena rebaudengoi]|nr:hypothetical protein C8J57DRAFT_1533635 [Mycena rebaudengoi]
MSDAIVCWGAWMLYHNNLKVLILCLLGSLDASSLQIKVQLDLPKNKKTKVERILVFLTESGILGAPSLFRDIPFLYTILTNQGEDTTGYKIVVNMISQLSAIYPVIIALLVSLDRTNLESTVIGISTNTDSDPIHFVGNTTGSGRPAPGRWGRCAWADVDPVVAEKEEKEKEDGAAELALPFRG